MSYVLMRALESAPRRYECGMRMLTLGCLEKVHQEIASHVNAGDRVLDIGCGTGALAVRLAQKGARVTGIDIAPPMLGQAMQRVRAGGAEKLVSLREMGVVELDALPSEGFDAISSVLVFSELSEEEIEFALAECWRILRPGGQLLVADEVLPDSTLGKIGAFLFRLPFAVAAFVLTQNTTHRVAGLATRIGRAGFGMVDREEYLLGTLELIFAEKAA